MGRVADLVFAARVGDLHRSLDLPGGKGQSTNIARENWSFFASFYFLTSGSTAGKTLVTH
jgi:hypothetical protein